mgnify:CR=1 FL=1
MRRWKRPQRFVRAARAGALAAGLGATPAARRSAARAAGRCAALSAALSAALAAAPARAAAQRPATDTIAPVPLPPITVTVLRSRFDLERVPFAVSVVELARGRDAVVAVEHVVAEPELVELDRRQRLTAQECLADLLVALLLRRTGPERAEIRPQLVHLTHAAHDPGHLNGAQPQPARCERASPRGILGEGAQRMANSRCWVGPHEEDGAGGVADDLIGHAATEDTRQRRADVHAQNDQARGERARDLDDRLGDRAVADELSGAQLGRASCRERV